MKENWSTQSFSGVFSKDKFLGIGKVHTNLESYNVFKNIREFFSVPKIIV